MHKNEQRIDASRTVLWASAFVIGALVILQAGRLPGNPAYADMVSSRDSYTILTSDSGRGEDAAPDEILVVVDNRSDAILVYEVDVRGKTLGLRDAKSLTALFRTALPNR